MIKNDRQKIPNMIHQDEWLPFDEAEREQAAAAAAKEQMIRRVQEQKFRAISQSVANEKRSSIVDALALDEKFRGVEAAEASIRDEANTRMDDILFVPEATTTKKRKGNGPKLNMIGESMATAKILNEPKRIRKLRENISKTTAAAQTTAESAPCANGTRGEEIWMIHPMRTAPMGVLPKRPIWCRAMTRPCMAGSVAC